MEVRAARRQALIGLAMLSASAALGASLVRGRTAAASDPAMALLASTAILLVACAPYFISALVMRDASRERRAVVAVVAYLVFGISFALVSGAQSSLLGFLVTVTLWPLTGYWKVYCDTGWLACNG